MQRNRVSNYRTSGSSYAIASKSHPVMPDRSKALRSFFAKYVCALAKVRDSRIEQAFAAVKREAFLGPGPWSIYLPGGGYIKTPDDDIAFIYQDTLVALDTVRGTSIGQPGAHACWLDGLALREGETVLQLERVLATTPPSSLISLVRAVTFMPLRSILVLPRALVKTWHTCPG